MKISARTDNICRWRENFAMRNKKKKKKSQW
jgi:hypothetical protein